MLLQIFSENEIVQILDPATSIWESAKIIAFINDWCVRIKWVDWSSKKKEDISVLNDHFPKKNDQKEIVGISGNRSDLFSRQRKRDDLRHFSSTLADWSEAIRSIFGNQSVIAWILIDAVMIVAVAQLWWAV